MNRRAQQQKEPKSAWFVGLDLGQAADYTALCVIEVPPETEEYHIRHLQRFRLGTPYPEIVEKVGTVVRQFEGATLAVDATGVGRPVVDLLNQAGLDPVAITITGGDTATNEGRSWKVPKRDLVSTLAVAFQTGKLKIAAGIPDAKTLVDELLAFKVKISTTGHDSYESWREGVHDDLVLAVAMAMWVIKNPPQGFACFFIGPTGAVGELRM